MKFSIFVLALFVVFGSCKPKVEATEAHTTEVTGTSSTDTIANKYDAVMALHDQAMIEMSSANNIRGEFKAITKTGDISRVTEVNVNIVQASDAMMQWMADFKTPKDKTAPSPYLDSEYEKIKVISNKLIKAKTDAAALLTELKAGK